MEDPPSPYTALQQLAKQDQTDKIITINNKKEENYLRSDSHAVPAVVVLSGEVLAVVVGDARPPLAGRLHRPQGRAGGVEHAAGGSLLHAVLLLGCKGGGGQARGRNWGK